MPPLNCLYKNHESGDSLFPIQKQFLEGEINDIKINVNKYESAAAKPDFKERVYTILYNKIRGKETIYLDEGAGLHEENLLGLLGRGSSKKAMELERGRALILPNLDVDRVNPQRWSRVVDEEVLMSELLTKIGLLSPISERVSVSVSLDLDERIPAIGLRSCSVPLPGLPTNISGLS